MCKASSSLILNHLGWKLGNGKHILLGSNCLTSLDLTPSGWLVTHGFSYLVDISCLDEHCLWCGWLALDLPNHLLMHWPLLIENLLWFFSIITSKLDSHAWMGGKYKKCFVKDGYYLLIKNPSSSLLSKLWGKFWNGDGHPKINIFCWELVHEKILTIDNLKKRKISSPSRCVLCGNTADTIKHLFVTVPLPWIHITML